VLVRALLLFFLFLLVARAVWRLLEGVARGAAGDAAAGPRRPAGGPAAVKMVQCAVCKTFVVPGRALSGVSRGQPVYFCSEACRAKFAA